MLALCSHELWRRSQIRSILLALFAGTAHFLHRFPGIILGNGPKIKWLQR
jgi:hypothetical protein